MRQESSWKGTNIVHHKQKVHHCTVGTFQLKSETISSSKHRKGVHLGLNVYTMYKKNQDDEVRIACCRDTIIKVIYQKRGLQCFLSQSNEVCPIF